MKNGFSVRKMAKQGVFASSMAVCAWIHIPFGDIAFTMQTFALFLALFTLGGKGGSTAFLVYLLMGAVGLPVFSGFRGGMSALLGTTGGYLWGLALAGPVYWALTRFFGKKAALPSAFLGLCLCYLLGTLWFLLVYAGDTGWWAVMLNCVVPYVLPDIIKIFLAYSIAHRLQTVIGET